MVKTYTEARLSKSKIVYCDSAPFDKALDAIEAKGGKIIAAKQLADARMEFDITNSLSQNGSYVREGSLFVPKGEHRRILLRNSLVLQNPSDAVSAHRQGKEYVISGTVEDVLDKMTKGKDYLFLDNLKPVPTDRFGEDERMNFLFGKSAQKYGLWLKDKGNISGTGFYNFRDDSYIDNQSGLFAGQVWLHRFDKYSDIISDNRWDLSCNVRVRGVSRIGETSEKKTSPYTPQHFSLLKNALHDEGISGALEKRIIQNIKEQYKR